MSLGRVNCMSEQQGSTSQVGTTLLQQGLQPATAAVQGYSHYVCAPHILQLTLTFCLQFYLVRRKLCRCAKS